MQKNKAFRTAECVSGGFCYAEKKPVADLLRSLGLFEESGCSTIDGGFLFHSQCSGLSGEASQLLSSSMKSS